MIRGAVLGMLFVSLPAMAADDPKVIVDRAIAAIGGEKAAADLKAGTWKTSGTVQDRPSRAEFHGQLPDKFRIDSTRPVDGQPVVFSRIINGSKGWVVAGDNVTPMTPTEIAGVKASYYHKQLATTLVMLLDKECSLKLADTIEVNGKPAIGIIASRKDYPDVTLYFDRESGLLAKTVMNEKNPVSGKERKVELILAEFKEFAGVKMATRTKTYHDGKLFLDTELVDFKKVPSLPDRMFDAP